MAEIVDTFDLWEESEKLSSEELPFSMEELAKKCIAGEYVLVVGSSVVLDEKWFCVNLGGNSSHI